jgi:hypothetical protein
MKKLFLILFISFLFTQNSIAQCDPVLTINEHFGFGLPACWTQPNGNTAIDNNNGIFWGHPTYGAVINLRDVANLEGTLVLQARTHENYPSSFHVERIQNGAIVSSQSINTTPTWQNFTINFSGFPGRGYIRIRQYVANSKGTRLAAVTYTSTCPATPEVVFKTTDLTVQLDVSGNASITPADVDLGSITTCGAAITNFSLGISTFTCAELGSNTVTLSAEDGNGNIIGTTPITITVEDIQAPTAIGQDIMVQTSASGEATITPAMIDNGSNDACGGGLTLSLSKTTFVCGETGDFIVTLTAEDASGNTASTDVTVNVSSSTINDQELTSTNGDFCPDGATTYPSATISTASSQVGLEYVLRKSSDNSIIDGPLAGTGSILNFNTGSLTETTGYNVFAQYIGATDNSALAFDGVNDYVATNINASFDYENGYTFESWVKVAVPVGGHWPIFSIGNSTISDIEIYVQQGTNKLAVFHDRGEASLGGNTYSVPPSNQWFHLAVTYDGGTDIKVYFDGVEQAITDANYTPTVQMTNTAGLSMKIAKIDHPAFGVGGSAFQGQLDEVRMWTTTRTTAEILANKDNCLVGTETDLEYYFPFDDSSGLTTTDLVNGTNGVLTNMDANTDWVASGTGFSCAKYVNCGYQMLSEINVGDATPPTIVAQNISVQIDANTGFAIITPADVDNGSSDNCSGVTLSLTKTEFDCSNIGANVVTLMVDDAAGNQSTVDATVTVTIGITDETVTANATNFCPGGGSVDISTGSSVTGIDYYLRNDADNAIVDGPMAGTGSVLSFNTGTLNSTATYNVYGEFVAPAPHSGLDFDGVNDKIVTTYIPPATNTLTVELWLYPRSAGFSRIISSYQGTSSVLGGEIVLDTYDATFNNGKALRFGVSGVSNNAHLFGVPNVLTLNTWNHVAATFTFGVIKLYVDGVLVGTSGSAPFSSLIMSSSNVVIGEDRIQGAAEYFNGQMDEVRIWNTAKTASEILAGKDRCLTGTESGLGLYYNFNENTGLTATDLKGNNNGTLTNMDSATDWVSSGVSISCGQSCGLEMTETVTVSVGDVVNPTAIAQNFTVQLDAAGNANITTADVDNGSADNCTSVGNLVLSLDKTAFACTDLGANTVTLTVEDATGNQSTTTATVTVEDIISPNAIAQNITIQLDATGNVAITAIDVNNGSSDNCTVANSLVLSLDKTVFTCGNLGANAVSLTVTDASNNQKTVMATVTVVDALAPTAITQDIIVQLDASGNASIVADDIDNDSADNCSSGLLLSLDIVDFSCTELGINTVTLTVEDATGNQSTATATVTVEDTVIPTVVTQDMVVNLDVAGNAAITAADIDNGSTDNCTSIIDLVMSLDVTSFTATHVGANTVTLTVEDVNGNFSTATATVTVEDKTNQDISFGTLSDATYGEQITLTATSDSGLPVSYEVISGPATISENTLSITEVGSVTIEATQPGDGTFAAAQAVQQSFTVNQAVITVTADDYTITYGDAIPVLTFVYSGFVNSENSTDLTSEPTISTVASATSDAVTYPISLAGGTADNYSITLVDGTLTINKVDQTITIDPIADKEITDGVFDVVASSNKGLTLTYAIESGPATISGSTVTLDGTTGTVVVEANQVGDVNHNVANATTSFAVSDLSKTDQTITFDDIADKTFGEVDFNLSATASSELSVSFAIVSGTATLSGNTVSIAGAGVVIIEATQTGDDSFNPASSVQKSFIVNHAVLTATADDYTITYGDLVPTLSYSYSGFVNDEDASALTSEPTISTTATDMSEAGTYPISLANGVANNYSFTLVDGTLTIDKADQTISVDPVDDKFITDAAFDIIASTTSGLALNYTIQSGPAAINGTTITLSGSTGTVVVEVTQAGDVNYNSANTSISFTITDPSKTGQTITIDTIADKFTTDTPFDVVANTTSNLALTYIVQSGPATISGTTITLDGTEGTVVVEVIQDGDANFNPTSASTSFDVTVNPDPCNGFSATVTSITDVVAGNDGAADISVTGGTEPYTYNWSNGTATQDLSGVIGGDYNVTVTDSNDCSESITLTIGDIVLATERDLNNTSISYYPNPVKDYLTIEASFEKPNAIEIQLMDMSGRVLTAMEIASSNQISTTMDVSNFKSGKYLLVIKTESTQKVERITITH